MSAEVLNADGGLVGFAELELRWKPAGKTAEARRRVVREQCARLGLRPVFGGRGEAVRFKFAHVIKAEDAAAGVTFNGRAAR
jgi:hypothetical protein